MAKGKAKRQLYLLKWKLKGNENKKLYLFYDINMRCAESFILNNTITVLIFHYFSCNAATAVASHSCASFKTIKCSKSIESCFFRMHDDDDDICIKNEA